jgi:hypothetical protein
MAFKLTYENILYLALGLVSILIIYKLFNMYNKNDMMEEGFQSIINKFKNTNSNNKKNKHMSKSNNNSSNFKNSTKNKKNNLSFDDIVAEAEAMDPGKYTVDSIKNNFFTYLESFQKAKFKNVSGTTDEALDKFGFFKEKFFEIFK